MNETNTCPDCKIKYDDPADMKSIKEKGCCRSCWQEWLKKRRE
jgi:hydrogenase maturation factor HypF (carbamoyltransferase family)